MSPYTQAVGEAFLNVDLAAVAQLQSDGKVEDRLRDDLMLEMRRNGWPVTKGGPNRFDLYVEGAWVFELKMMYSGDHIYGMRGSRADVEKLRTKAAGMTKLLATIVSWHEGNIYPRSRRCEHGTDRAACIRHWSELITQISGKVPVAYQREDLVLFLVEL